MPPPPIQGSFNNNNNNNSNIANKRGFSNNTGQKDTRFGKRPFRVHVSKVKSQLAFEDGFMNIVIDQDLVWLIRYDENLVAAVMAHGFVHAMQHHVQAKAFFSHENFGQLGM